MNTSNSIQNPQLQHMRILEQAFEYLSIDDDKKEKILETVDKKGAENPDASLLDLLTADDLVSEDELEYFKIFDEYLKTQDLDQQFGEIAVANHFTSQKAVDLAFEHQRQYFEKYRINTSIGDVLLEDEAITISDRNSILLTQNRINDDQLLDALNSLGNTISQQDAVNRRFGALAIKKGLVSIDQVNKALEVQQAEQETGKNRRFLGKILQESDGLAEEDILAVLLEQKLFEKRRLDLERALYDIKSEIKISKKLNKLFSYEISDDGVEAFAKKLTDTATQVPVYEFLIWLRRTGIKVGIVSDTILEEYIQTAEKNARILVAKGFAPTPCTHETIEFFFQTGDMPETNPSDSTSDQSDSENADAEDTDNELKTSDQNAPDQEASEQAGPEQDEKEIPDTDDESDQPESEDSDTSQTDADEAPEVPELASGEPDESDETPPDPENDESPAEETADENSPLPEDESGPDVDSHETQEAEEPPDVESTPQEEDLPPLELVETGAILAKVVPGEDGRPGKDVFGYPIKPDKPIRCSITAGQGVVRKGALFTARRDGQPMLKQGTILTVEAVSKGSDQKKITAAIRNDTQEAYTAQHLEMNSDITAEAVLRCQGLTTSGNILGQVICQDDIEIRSSGAVTHAVVHTAGQLSAIHSTVTGSDIIACKGITIKEVLGSEEKPSLLAVGLMPGDKLLATDHTIETKQSELSVLKKEKELKALTEEYEKELEKEQIHLAEQETYKALVQIIEGPELYQHETLKDKIDYLIGLPDYSSIKAFYLVLPENKPAQALVKKMLELALEISIEDLLGHIKKQIDPEPETDTESDAEAQNEADQESSVAAYDVETQFKGRFAALENEVAANQEAITGLENEINGLLALQKKLCAANAQLLSQPSPAIKVKDKCEKGTVIRGSVARLVLDQNIYRVKFREVMNPKTQTVSISIESF